VPLARDLHPEFGYVGSAPRLFRRLGLVLSFVVFGLIAAASGVAVFTADPDPDPMHAMALAPADAVKATSPAPQTAASVETKAAQAPFAQKTSKAAGAIKSPCRDSARDSTRESTAEVSGGDCTPARAVKPHPVLAVNERPAIAAVPIGHRDDPAVLPSQPATPIPVAALPETPEASAAPEEAAPAAEVPPVPPAVASGKARTRNQHAQASRRQRDRNEYSSSSRYSNQSVMRGGWGGIW
jgi:hypothetical protein